MMGNDIKPFFAGEGVIERVGLVSLTFAGIGYLVRMPGLRDRTIGEGAQVTGVESLFA